MQVSMEYFEVLLGGQLTWSSPLLAGIICISILYSLLIKRATNIKVNHMQPLLFFLGLGLLYLTIGSPLSNISHLSFSLHMIQMSILYFIIPPITLLGIPKFSSERTWKVPLLTSKIALTTFATLFFLYHVPAVLNFLSQNNFDHNGYLVLLFVLSFRMWWPIVRPVTKTRFSKNQERRYAFLSGLVLMPACLFFILNALMDGMSNPFLTQVISHLCTPSQSSSFTVLPPPFNTKFDQLMAGIFMLAVHKLGLMLTFKLGNNNQKKTATK